MKPLLSGHKPQAPVKKHSPKAQSSKTPPSAKKHDKKVHSKKPHPPVKKGQPSSLGEGFQALPEELRFNAYTFLNRSDLKNLRQVSKTFNHDVQQYQGLEANKQVNQEIIAAFDPVENIQTLAELIKRYDLEEGPLINLLKLPSTYIASEFDYGQRFEKDKIYWSVQLDNVMNNENVKSLVLKKAIATVFFEQPLKSVDWYSLQSMFEEGKIPSELHSFFAKKFINSLRKTFNPETTNLSQWFTLIGLITTVPEKYHKSFARELVAYINKFITSNVTDYDSWHDAKGGVESVPDNYKKPLMKDLADSLKHLIKTKKVSSRKAKKALDELKKIANKDEQTSLIKPLAKLII